MNKAKINGTDYSFKMSLGVFKRLSKTHGLTFKEIQDKLGSDDMNLEILFDFMLECNKAAHNLDNNVVLLPENFEDLINVNDLGNIIAAISDLPTQEGGESNQGEQ
jgi:hypothetical protein